MKGDLLFNDKKIIWNNSETYYKGAGIVDDFNSINQQNEKSLEDLRCQIVELKEELDKRICEVERSREVIAELTKKNQFLKGSIEAYQYCMNCRR